MLKVFKKIQKYPIKLELKEFQWTRHCTQNKTEPLEVIVGDHHELMCFHLYRSKQHCLILGFPWLQEHNLHID